MAKNKRNWAEINSRKGKAYRVPEETKAKRRPSAPARSKNVAEESWQDELPAGAILGRNPVIEALRNDREIEKILVGKGAEGSIAKIVGIAKDKGIPIYQSDKQALDRIAAGAPHQGVIAYASAYHYSEMEDIYAIAEAAVVPPLVVILDNL